MKKRNLLVGLFSIFGIVAMSNTLFAQQNLGAACGCPTVATRGTAAITSLGTWTTLPASAYGKELQGNQNITLTCGTIWTLNEKLYIASGSTLTIEPGTVIKASDALTNVAAARAIIIERGGKINAAGVEDCPIVFTAEADPLDGTYTVNNKGKWGGILLCGTATNNLKLNGNGPFVPGQGGKMAVADGLGVLEGFASSYPQDQFGVAVGTAPAGYVSATSPTGTYTFTSATGAQQNHATTNVLAAPAALAGLATLYNGSTVSGTGVPASTTVSYTSGTTYTLSQAATANLTGSYAFALATPITGASATSALGQNVLNLTAANSSILVGMTVTGTGVASGATVSSISSTAITLSSNLTAAASGTYTFGLPSLTASDILNTSGSAKVKLSSIPSYLMSGVDVSGTGIPNGAKVLSVGSSFITLTLSATAAVSGNLTFTGDYTNGGVTALFPTSSLTSAVGPVGLVTGSNPPVYVNYAGVSISASGQSFNDNDNSGVMTYVSIRHSGANLLVGSEINGLTLASVGSGTKIEHIEIVSCADDNIEIFGGTVDLKYCSTLFGNDDMFDYDLGWTGRAQFLFGMKADLTSGVSADNDNGFECDGDDGKTYATPISAPKIYNATVMGNAKTATTADNTGMIGLCLKEFAAGEIRNSIFAGFKEGVRMTSITAATASYGNRSIAFGGETVHNYLATGTTPSATTGNGSQSLKVKCNTFIGNTTAVNAFDAQTTAVAQLATDGNLFPTSMTGFSSAFVLNPTTFAVTTKNDAVPAVGEAALGAGCTMAPFALGFFEPANYRGAFEPNNQNANWLSDWSYSQILGSTLGVVACPTDLNGDGITNTADFLIFAPAFGTNCN
jgi:hypothetical protein